MKYRPTPFPKPRRSAQWYEDQALWFAKHIDDPTEREKHERIAAQLAAKRRFGQKGVVAFFHDYNLYREWSIEPKQDVPPQGVKSLYGSLARIKFVRGAERVIYIGGYTADAPSFSLRAFQPKPKIRDSYGLLRPDPISRLQYDTGYDPLRNYNHVINLRLTNTKEIVGEGPQQDDEYSGVKLATVNIGELNETDGSEEQYPFPTIIVGKKAIQQWAAMELANPRTDSGAKFAKVIDDLPSYRWPTVTYQTKNSI